MFTSKKPLKFTTKPSAGIIPAPDTKAPTKPTPKKKAKNGTPWAKKAAQSLATQGK